MLGEVWTGFIWLRTGINVGSCDTVMNLRVSKKVGYFFTLRANIRFSKRIGII
jgi:hypothetical protein